MINITAMDKKHGMITAHMLVFTQMERKKALVTMFGLMVTSTKDIGSITKSHHGMDSTRESMSGVMVKAILENGITT